MKKPQLSELTLREKIGQTVIFRHMLLEKFSTMEEIAEYHKNNTIGTTWTMEHPKEVYRVIETAMGNPDLEGYPDTMYVNYVNTINKSLSIPVMPAIDATHGLDYKFRGHAELSTATSLGATKDPELAYRYGKYLGEDLRSCGINWIWSPVVDNAGRFRGTRRMSTNTEENKPLLEALIRGFHDAGVATCAKHFPGDDPYEYRDSHFCTSSYNQSYEHWCNTQRKDFEDAIAAGADSIMVGHKTFRAVDDTRVNGNLLPSTLSYKVVTELLKGEMGFKGVVLTDDIDMKSLATIYPQEKLYVEVLRAGIDMVLGPARLDYVDIVEKAVLDGDLPESRIDDACQRVLDMKERFGLFDQGEIPHQTEEKRNEIRAKLGKLSQDIAEKSMTLVCNHLNFLPIAEKNIKKVKVVYIGYSENCYANIQKYMVEEFAKHGATCDVQNTFEWADNDTLNGYDLIVYATYIGFFAPAGGPYFFGEQCHMLRKLMTVATEKSVAVSFGDPDIYFNYFTAAHAFINAYSDSPETITTFVKALYGEVDYADYFPFPLNPITRTNEVY